jgi:TolB-like protein
MKAVAVLPFDHPGADQTGELLAIGLQDDILVSLSKVADLKVISRSSVLHYAGKQTDPREIGRALRVDAVLIGSLRQTGRQARVNVELLRTADGTQIWANSFDREINDIFGIQSDLAFQIASALKATVLPVEVNGIRRQATHDSQAYLWYVQASDIFADPDRVRAKLEKAEQLLQQAIERDPKFALAFALYSQIEAILTGVYDPTPERLQKTRALAEQAVALNSDLPQAHIAMGRYLWQAQGRFGTPDLAGARREFQIAQRTLPGSAELRSFIGRIQMQQGEWDEARANLEQAAALDPLTAERWNTLFGINFQTRRYSAALDAIEHEIALMPNSWRCEWQRALILMSSKGDLSGFERLRPQPTSDGNVYHGLGFGTLMLLRHYDEAEAMVRNDRREMLPGFDLGLVPKSLFFGYICEANKDQKKGREYFEAALPFAERAVAEAPWLEDRHMGLGELYAALHRKQDAIREGKRGCELVPESRDAFAGPLLLPSMAHIYMKVGEPELALNLLENSLSVPAGAHVGELRVSPRWDQLRKHQRFQYLLAKYAPRE